MNDNQVDAYPLMLDRDKQGQKLVTLLVGAMGCKIDSSYPVWWSILQNQLELVETKRERDSLVDRYVRWTPP